ncbi:hypothetical protein HK102_004805 [Quaeritorhiza haematococci]|nr:hypothetical protein HK102_004805 [Quaeritorhiza haematococci]
MSAQFWPPNQKTTALYDSTRGGYCLRFGTFSYEMQSIETNAFPLESTPGGNTSSAVAIEFYLMPNGDVPNDGAYIFRVESSANDGKTWTVLRDFAADRDLYPNRDLWTFYSLSVKDLSGPTIKFRFTWVKTTKAFAVVNIDDLRVTGVSAPAITSDPTSSGGSSGGSTGGTTTSGGRLPSPTPDPTQAQMSKEVTIAIACALASGGVGLVFFYVRWRLKKRWNERHEQEQQQKLQEQQQQQPQPREPPPPPPRYPYGPPQPPQMGRGWQPPV